MKVPVAFVVVTYHPNAIDLRVMTSVLKPWIVHIVDNTNDNKGFGAAANKGIQKLINKGAQWIIVLNQDVTITRQGIEQFVKKLLQTPIGIAGPVVGWIDAKRWTTNLSKYDHGQIYVSGSWLAIHKDVINKIGGFFKPYFLYYEDADLSVRATKSGFILSKVPFEGFLHTETSSLGKNSIAHQYYLARNHLLFVKRNAPMSVKFYEAIRLPKTIWEHRSRKEPGALQGIKDFLFGVTGKWKGQK